MFSNLMYRLRALFRRNSMEAELGEELRAHIEQQTEKYVQARVSTEDAARRARLEFGGIEQTREGSPASQDRRHQKAGVRASHALRGLDPAADQRRMPEVLRSVGANLRKCVVNLVDTSAIETLDETETSSNREVGTLEWPPARPITQKLCNLILARREGDTFIPTEYRTGLRGREEYPR
jgi:hypothetical protein